MHLLFWLVKMEKLKKTTISFITINKALIVGQLSILVIIELVMATVMMHGLVIG